MALLSKQVFIFFIATIPTLFSCQNTTTEETLSLDPYKNLSIKPQLFSIPTNPFERSNIKSGDTLKIYGGRYNFLKKHLGISSCRAVVQDIYFGKYDGISFAFIDIQDSLPKQFTSCTFAVTLYYHNSKIGYAPAAFQLWDNIPTTKQRAINQDAMKIKNEYISVDESVMFKKTE